MQPTPRFCISTVLQPGLFLLVLSQQYSFTESRIDLFTISWLATQQLSTFVLTLVVSKPFF